MRLRQERPRAPEPPLRLMASQDRDDRGGGMAAFEVADLSAREILDSRGRPTLAVTVRLAVAAVNTELSRLLRGRSWASLADADGAMVDLDGTANKSRLGANATVGVRWPSPAHWRPR